MSIKHLEWLGSILDFKDINEDDLTDGFVLLQLLSMISPLSIDLSLLLEDLDCLNVPLRNYVMLNQALNHVKSNPPSTILQRYQGPELVDVLAKIAGEISRISDTLLQDAKAGQLDACIMILGSLNVVWNLSNSIEKVKDIERGGWTKEIYKADSGVEFGVIKEEQVTESKPGFDQDHDDLSENEEGEEENAYEEADADVSEDEMEEDIDLDREIGDNGLNAKYGSDEDLDIEEDLNRDFQVDEEELDIETERDIQTEIEMYEEVGSHINRAVEDAENESDEEIDIDYLFPSEIESAVSRLEVVEDIVDIASVSVIATEEDIDNIALAVSGATDEDAISDSSLLELLYLYETDGPTAPANTLHDTIQSELVLDFFLSNQSLEITMIPEPLQRSRQPPLQQSIQEHRYNTTPQPTIDAVNISTPEPKSLLKPNTPLMMPQSAIKLQSYPLPEDKIILPGDEVLLPEDDNLSSDLLSEEDIVVVKSTRPSTSLRFNQISPAVEVQDLELLESRELKFTTLRTQSHDDEFTRSFEQVEGEDIWDRAKLALTPKNEKSEDKLEEQLEDEIPKRVTMELIQEAKEKRLMEQKAAKDRLQQVLIQKRRAQAALQQTLITEKELKRSEPHDHASDRKPKPHVESSRKVKPHLLSAKSNKSIVKNALLHVSLAGSLNRALKAEVLQDLNESASKHFVILLKEVNNFAFRGLYFWDKTLDQTLKLYSGAVGPVEIDPRAVRVFYKYDCGARTFKEIPTKTFGGSCDAVAIGRTYKVMPKFESVLI